MRIKYIADVPHQSLNGERDVSVTIWNIYLCPVLVLGGLEDLFSKSLYNNIMT